MNKQAQLQYLFQKRDNLYLKLDEEPRYPWSVHTEITMVNESIWQILNAQKERKDGNL